jgi:hypothetical protein
MDCICIRICCRSVRVRRSTDGLVADSIARIQIGQTRFKKRTFWFVAQASNETLGKQKLEQQQQQQQQQQAEEEDEREEEGEDEGEEEEDEQGEGEEERLVNRADSGCINPYEWQSDADFSDRS